MREEIVTGKRDPRPEELKNTSDFKKGEKEEDLPKIDLEEIKNSKGVAGFWLGALKNNPQIQEQIKEHDEPILKHLTNIKHELLEDNVFHIKLNFVELQIGVYV